MTIPNLQQARPHWFDGQGNLKPARQIRDEEATQEYARRRVELELQARTHRDPTDDERLIASLDSLIEARQRDHRYAGPADKLSLLEYIDDLKAKRAEVVEKIAEEKRVEKLAANPQVRNARAHAEAFARTPPPGSDPVAVAVAVAIATSNDFSDPAELSRNYFAEVSKIEEAVALHSRQQAAAAREAASKAGWEAAKADLAVAETDQRLAQAREAAGE